MRWLPFVVGLTIGELADNMHNPQFLAFKIVPSGFQFLVNETVGKLAYENDEIPINVMFCCIVHPCGNGLLARIALFTFFVISIIFVVWLQLKLARYLKLPSDKKQKSE